MKAIRLAIVPALLSIGILLCLDLRPGGWHNPHEWLNDTMKKEKLTTSSTLGHWVIPNGPTFSDLELNMNIAKNISVVQANKSTYSMLEISLPDGRVFVADYCLKHGEFVLRQQP